MGEHDETLSPAEQKAKDLAEQEFMQKAIDDWLDRKFATFSKFIVIKAFFLVAFGLILWVFQGWLASHGWHKVDG